MKVTLEKHFEKLLQDKFIEAGAHVVRLPDDLKVAIAQGKSTNALGKRKPYDFGVCFQGHYYAIECKLVKGLTFYSEQVEKHQWEGLKEAQEAGATPLLAIYFKSKLVVQTGKGATKERTETFIEKWALINVLACGCVDELRETCFTWKLGDLKDDPGAIYVDDQFDPKERGHLSTWLDIIEGS